MTATARETRPLRPPTAAAARAALAALGDIVRGAVLDRARNARAALQHHHLAGGQRPTPWCLRERTAEVQAIVRICASHGVPVIPFGAGTSLEGQVKPLVGASASIFAT